MCLAPTHPFVDVASGMINTPAVVSWSFPSSKLDGLLAEMSTNFGEQSPVYTRPVAETPAAISRNSTPTYYGDNHRPQGPSTPPVSDPYTTSDGSYFPNPLRNPAPSPTLPAEPNTLYPTYPTTASAGRSHYPPAHNPYIASAQPTYPSPDSGLYGSTPATRPPPTPPAYPVGGAVGYPGGPPPMPQGQPQPPPNPGTSAEAAKARRSAAFRRTAMEALTKRLLASLQQSEPEIQQKTAEALGQRTKLEENRKVGPHLPALCELANRARSKCTVHSGASMQSSLLQHVCHAWMSACVTAHIYSAVGPEEGLAPWYCRLPDTSPD